jgi:hypothetical protein
MIVVAVLWLLFWMPHLHPVFQRVLVMVSLDSVEEIGFLIMFDIYYYCITFFTCMSSCFISL